MSPDKSSSIKKVNAKRKIISPLQNLSIYMFENFEDYLGLCNLINNRTNTNYAFLKKSALYSYKSQYYLCIYIDNKNLNAFKSIHYSIIEYSLLVKDATLFERKLKEYGKPIFKSNAINNCIKHFK